jgi:hypothetical protein
MHQLSVAVAACVALAACVDVPTTPSLSVLLPPPSSALVPLDQFGIGQGGTGNACEANEYRQFDFWLGNWDVRDTTDVLTGVSIVSSALGGCAVLENFAGGIGRSLNAYDQATGNWTQFFVSAGGSIAMLTGGFRNDSMVLAEQRGPVIRDVWTWTTLPNGSVKQHEEFFLNGVLLPNGFLGIYTRRATPPSPPAPEVTACARDASRQMDFLVGTWDVYSGHGKGQGAAQGTLVVSVGAGGCLIEESLKGPGGFEALSYASYHAPQRRWVRSYMDTEARYIRLFGNPDGKSMVMTGNRPGANGSTVVVRVTWEPMSPNLVLQRWEFSADGGTTFNARQEYTFVKR